MGRRNDICYRVMGGAIALSFGTYPCEDCTLPPISGPREQPVMRTVVNKDVTSRVDSDNEPNSVTLCNSNKCGTYQYIPLSGLFLKGAALGVAAA